jgi:hypothetical protein
MRKVPERQMTRLQRKRFIAIEVALSELLQRRALSEEDSAVVEALKKVSFSQASQSQKDQLYSLVRKSSPMALVWFSQERTR